MKYFYRVCIGSRADFTTQKFWWSSKPDLLQYQKAKTWRSENVNNDPTTNLDFFRLAILKDILLNLVIDKITEVFIQTQLV